MLKKILNTIKNKRAEEVIVELEAALVCGEKVKTL